MLFTFKFLGLKDVVVAIINVAAMFMQLTSVPSFTDKISTHRANKTKHRFNMTYKIYL